MRTATDSVATREQIVMLQTLYSQWQRHSLPDGDDARRARLAWASENLGRELSSFSHLTRDEARGLIDALKGSMGQPVNSQPNPWRRIRSRERAQSAGRAGRKNNETNLVQLVSSDDLARIEQTIQRLGWTQERFEAWLKSNRSPLAHTDNPGTIRTVAEANRIWWALKAMLRRSGQWSDVKGSGRKPNSDIECPDRHS